jgi:hypothetical protein
MISTSFMVAESTNANPSTGISSVIEYQIGTKGIYSNGSVWVEYWSDWASDGDEAEVTYESMSWYGIYAIKIRAPGYHVEYQIGTKCLLSNGSIWLEYWSDWASDGDEAEVTYHTMSWPGVISVRVRAPGYYVEYQIGTKGLFSNGSVWVEYWSDWTSNGDEAEVTYESWSWPGIISFRAVMIVPTQAVVDIDADTLNLKSKGRWITSYITLNTPYNVNDIDSNSVMLEDTIPIEWGDVQNDTLMVKFDRSDVEDMLSPGTYNLKVAGELADGTSFEGYSDEIRVIDPGK